MGCMRCGKNTAGKAVFCDECLNEMAQYPVKPGTLVQIPLQPESAEPRRPVRKRKELPLEEQVATLRLLVRRLCIAVAALVLALGICLASLISVMTAPEETAPTAPTGRNYTTSGSIGD